MSAFKTLLVITFVGFLYSCENDNQRTENNSNNTLERTTPENSVNDRKGNENVENHSNNSNLNNSLNSEINSPELDRMYKDLDMTDKQINSFEEDYSRKVKSIKNSNDNKIDQEKKMKIQKDESLKSVLSEDQFNEYKDWKNKE